MDKEKFGKIIIDGREIDLDNAPIEELKKLQAEIENREEATRAEIDEYLINLENQTDEEK